MSESRALYGEKSTLLAVFPDPVRPALHLIQENPSSEAGRLLLQFVASLVHPDYVCSLALLDRLPIPVKEAALEVFEFYLTAGLSLNERGAILRFIEPHLARSLGASRPR